MLPPRSWPSRAVPSAGSPPQARRADADVADRGEVLALYVDPGDVGARCRAAPDGRGPAATHRRGFTDAVLWVLVGNDRAQRFYRADGWRPDGQRRSVEIWEVEVDEVRYPRRLS